MRPGPGYLLGYGKELGFYPSCSEKSLKSISRGGSVITLVFHRHHSEGFFVGRIGKGERVEDAGGRGCILTPCKC